MNQTIRTDAQEYLLRLYDQDLLRFSLEKKGLQGLVPEILEVHEELVPLFPLDLELSSEGILKWLQRRVIPKNRAFVDEILKTLGLSHNDTQGIIDACKGLSLNDSYWVVPSGFEGSFAQCNLYENHFSEMLALVAYTGAGRSHGRITTSPELTTSGMLPKAWRLIDGKGIFLYKGGTSGASNAGREPYCEYYASQIAVRMGLDAVSYGLQKWKGITASTCPLFTDIDTAYVPVGRIVQSGGLAACLEFYEQLGDEFVEHARSMLVFDAIILNEDRHFGNFGILRDNRSGKIVAPAPIFDNGMSLLSQAAPMDLKSDESVRAYASTRLSASGISFEEIVREVMGAEQKAQLRRLIGFRFERHSRLNLPEPHLQALEKMIQERVRLFLDI